MGKRCPEPPVHELIKRRRLATEEVPTEVKFDSVLTDLSGKKWRLGSCIGTGAFGEIYLASDQIDKEVAPDSQYVVKVESYTSGPLFVEINCYLRIAKPEMIIEWKKENNIQHLGMPYYVASGSHVVCGAKYRFLVIPRYEKNLEQLLTQNYKFNLKTVLVLSIQILNTLRYIHSKGYIHSDIKASNILLDSNKSKRKTSPVLNKTVVRYHGCTPFRTCKARRETFRRNLRPNSNLRYIDDFGDKSSKVVSHKEESNNQAYLLDYGLASKYLHSNGEHKQFCVDQRRAHAGTILFCSRDAHDGMQARRSDLECLGYNMVYWLTGYLPWMDDSNDPKIAEKKKRNCMENVEEFLNLCFVNDYPRFLCKYFKYLTGLGFEDKPDYGYCADLFHGAIKEYGYKDNMCFDFDNLEGWGRKQKITNNRNNTLEKKNKIIRRQKIMFKVVRSPLRSNLPILRKRLKVKTKTPRKIRWPKMLLDPETIMKQGKCRERRTTETTDSGSVAGIHNLNIEELNPTPTMVEVYNKSIERINSANGSSPTYKGDVNYDNIEGYTPAMMAVFNRKKEREEMEAEQLMLLNSKTSSRAASRQRRRPISASSNTKTKRQDVPVRNVKSQNAVRTVGKKENPKKAKTTIRRIYSLRG
ncbi:serine/threonine-protein kinase VRK1-like isoform X2 [Agrilus planipennis]|uniref:non-specific serine/threonine protein kinase n=1 Tax=Agrilus planipennis TaxID=224129 RepID=A0A1W4XRH9_AGRPL|nr:serine/threonine-protein kinase VRK1-like isoform X2 [Agrilus planipennis]